MAVAVSLYENSPTHQFIDGESKQRERITTFQLPSFHTILATVACNQIQSKRLVQCTVSNIYYHIS